MSARHRQDVLADLFRCDDEELRPDGLPVPDNGDRPGATGGLVFEVGRRGHPVTPVRAIYNTERNENLLGRGGHPVPLSISLPGPPGGEEGES